MTNPTPEVVGMIVAGAIAGVVLIVAFVIITVYCYRLLDRADNKKLLKNKRNLRYIENAGYLPDPMYYGNGTSSVGTAARPYPFPVLVGAPDHYPGEGYHSAATTLEKNKRKKAFVNYQNTRAKNYDEREDHMDFEEENQEASQTVLKGDNPASDPVPRPDDDEPVIVTYLLDPKDPSQETDVKTASKEGGGLIPPPPPPPLPLVTAADPDNGEQTPSVTSDPEDGEEYYHHRQREPPKGDIGPPVEYQVSRL